MHVYGKQADKICHCLHSAVRSIYTQFMMWPGAQRVGEALHCMELASGI